MTESKTKKSFNYKLYSIVALLLVAVILVLITAYAFRSKYIQIDAEKTALTYADSVIQSGDGYSAYNYSLAAKSEKYGDFIRIYYMYPLIYPGYEPGMSDDEFDAIKENGYDTDQYMSEATENDDGTLAGELADAMYPYYVELVNTYGWDDYDSIYSNYFARLVEERKAIFGDEYLDDDVMFTAFESNVSTYSNAVTGTEEELGDDDKTVVQEKTIGLYQEMYGEDYVITTSAVSTADIEDIDSYVAALDADALETYGVDAEDISAVQCITVEGTLEDGTVIASIDVYVVQIGNTWYVDNTTTVTSSVYTELLSGITA